MLAAVVFIFNFVSNLKEGLVPGKYLEEVLLYLSIPLTRMITHSFNRHVMSVHCVQTLSYNWGNSIQHGCDACPALNGIPKWDLQSSEGDRR